jgi:hypothetical protein
MLMTGMEIVSACHSCALHGNFNRAVRCPSDVFEE